MATGIISALILHNFGVQGWSFALLTAISMLVGGLVLYVVIFIYNCIRWRDLPDPPRHLKWKQRQHIADVLRQTEPNIASMSLWDGVQDAQTFADEIKAAFQDAGWAVDIGDNHLTGDLEHEFGLWVYGHSRSWDSASKARELIAVAFRRAGVPIHVDRRTNLGGCRAEIIVGRFDEQPDSGDLNP